MMSEYNRQNIFPQYITQYFLRYAYMHPDALNLLGVQSLRRFDDFFRDRQHSKIMKQRSVIQPFLHIFRHQKFTGQLVANMYRRDCIDHALLTAESGTVHEHIAELLFSFIGKNHEIDDVFQFFLILSRFQPGKNIIFLGDFIEAVQSGFRQFRTRLFMEHLHIKLASHSRIINIHLFCNIDISRQFFILIIHFLKLFVIHMMIHNDLGQFFYGRQIFKKQISVDGMRPAVSGFIPQHIV